MMALVHVDGTEPDDLGELRRWLAAEPAVRTHGALRTTSAAGTTPGQMGVVEVLSLVLGTGLTAAQLVLAIAQWRATRPRPPAVVITITEPDGATVRVESADPAAIAAAAQALDAGSAAGRSTAGRSSAGRSSAGRSAGDGTVDDVEGP